MGRLTLNVLLSFAQFEREVTSERIRDKIAASKRKGLWVGGPLSLGYDMNYLKENAVAQKAPIGNPDQPFSALENHDSNYGLEEAGVASIKAATNETTNSRCATSAPR
jgi:hypothetical protein